jgi:tetratricopeptide (TPR) repeat protein
MRIHPIFFVSLVLSAQVAQEFWTQPIEALINSGNLTQAHELLERETTARGETPGGLYLEAKILFEQGRYAESLEVARRSVAMAPTDPKLYKLAALSAIRMDRLDIAEPDLQTAARLAPGDYLVHFHLGALHYTKSLFLLAKPELEKAAELNPHYMPALLFLGLALEEVGDEKTTVATYRRAMEVAANGAAGKELPHLYLGRFYYRLNRLEDSLPLLEKAAEINPSSAEAQLQLGKALHALKRDDKAVGALERSVAANSKDPEPHYLLFRILESQGRAQAAQAELKEFQELSKQHPANDAARRRLQMSSQ